MATYVVMGNPIPLARHRHGNGQVWDSQKELKLIWGIDVARQHAKQCGERKYTGPLHLDVIFFLPIPKTSVRREAQIRGTYHIFRPDLSNLIKFIEDASTGVLFDNDCIIASLTCKKIYDSTPRTEFTVKALGEL